MSSKKSIGEITFIIMIPLLGIIFQLDVKTLLYSVVFSYSIMFFIQRLFDKYTKNKKAQNLVYFGFVYQYFFILWIYYDTFIIGNKASLIISDAEIYYQYAKELVNSDNPIQYLIGTRLNYIGYPLILGYFYKVFYVNFFLGLLLNVIIGTFNIYLLANIATLITNNKKIVYWTILFAIISPQMNSAATYLLKDVFIVMAFLLVVLGSLLSLRKKWTKAVLCIGLGAFLTAMLRLPILPIFLAMGFYLTLYKIGIKQAVILMILIGGFLYIYSATNSLAANNYLNSGVNSVENVSRGFSNELSFSENNSITKRLILGYDNWSVTKRIIYIPVFTIIQFLTPVNFWSFDHETPRNYIVINMQFIWIFFLGLLTIFSVLNIKRLKNRIIFKLMLSCGLGYILIAFMYGGTIPRYAYPFYAIFNIVAAYTYVNIEKDSGLKMKYINFKRLFFMGCVFITFLYLGAKII